MITVGLIVRCLTIAYMPMFAVLQQVHRCAKKHVQQSSSLLSIRQQFVKGRRMHVGMYTFFLSLSLSLAWVFTQKIRLDALAWRIVARQVGTVAKGVTK